MTLGYVGTDWETTVDPLTTRAFHGEDVWPEGAGSDSAGGDKDPLIDGAHPILALHPKANRAEIKQTGVLMTYDPETDIGQFNIARGYAVRAVVANINSYSGADTPDGWVTSVAVGQPVYVDDSPSLSAGVTLSMSPQNDLGAENPLAGYIHRDQDEYDASGIGGYAGDIYPITKPGSTDESTYVVMLK